MYVVYWLSQSKFYGTINHQGLFYALNLINHVHFMFIILVGRVFANGPEDCGSIHGRVIPKNQKVVLDTSVLNTYNACSVKWGGLEEGVAPFPTLRCCSRWKGSLRIIFFVCRLFLKLFSVVWKNNLNISNRVIDAFLAVTITLGQRGPKTNIIN